MRALKWPAAVKVEIAVDSDAAGSVSVHYRAYNASEGYVVKIVLLENARDQNVAGGENMGRRLSHANVVRSLRTVSVGEGTVSLALPEDVARENTTVVAHVQNADNMRIVGASSARSTK